MSMHITLTSALSRSSQVTRVFSQSGYAACPYEIKLDGTNMDILTPQGPPASRGWSVCSSVPCLFSAHAFRTLPFQ